MMDMISVLIAVGFVHFAFFFFNTIFVSCMHLPYLTLLKKAGLEIQLLRIKWFTTAFNRPLMKWGLNRSKFWSMWFSLGLITTIALIPISIIFILRLTFDNFVHKQTLSTGKNEQVLELMIPGVDIPYNELGYYVLSLIMCSVVHELGHAMAAVKEDVRFFGMGMILFFIVPVAFVQISDEQLNILSPKNRLRILCAGVWHNIILAGLAFIALGIITLIFSPFFLQNSGVFIKDINPNSAVLGVSGLSKGDVIHSINDCPVKNTTNWRTCIIQASQSPTPGYCVTEKMVKELDKFVITQEKIAVSHNCCEKHYEDKGYLCYEQLGGYDIQSSQGAIYYCLPTRAIVESSHSSCQNNEQCLMFNDVCIRPGLNNMTKVVQIQRYGRKDVIFLGHPSEIYHSIELTDRVPRFSFLNPYLPEASILLCKYIAIFSSGLAIINVVPCFHFDGQHIATLLTDILLKNIILHQGARSVIALVVTTIFTLLVGINLLSMYLNKV